MKFIIFSVIFAYMVLQTIYASPLFEFDVGFNFNGSVGNNQGSLGYQFSRDRSNSNPFSALTEGLVDLGKDISDGLRRGAEDGINAGAQFAEAVEIAVEGFKNEANQFADSVAVTAQEIFENSVTNFISTISALQQTISTIINGLEESIQRNILLQVQFSLRQTVSAAQSLQIVVDITRDNLNNQVDEGASEIINSWNNWANIRLNDAFRAVGGNRKTYKRVEVLLDDYINTFSGYLNQCVEQVFDEFQNYETSVQDTIQRYQRVIQSLIREVQICLRSTNLQCQRNINNQLRALRNAPREFSAFKDQGKQILNTDFENRVCVNRTLSEYENEQPEVSYKIDSIIDRSITTVEK